MTLSNRLTLYLLATVAVVLLGFSTALYALAAQYLHRQVDERLDAALNTLVAAAEVNDHGVQWEPEERRLSFGRRTVEGQFRWLVADEGGHRLDGSTPIATGPALPTTAPPAGPPARPTCVTDAQGNAWRVLARRLDSPRPRVGPGEPIPAADRATTHEALVLSAGVALAGVSATLRNLALTLAGLSGLIWGLALLGARRVCRRALRPVTAMAAAAHAIAGHEFDERLPVPATGDELTGLGHAFNGLLARQHEAHQRQQRFAGDASHQLRTPLTAIQGHVDLALRQARPVEEYRRVLTVVQRQTRHLCQIVEALLFLARADAEATQPRLGPIALDAWLRDHLNTRVGPRSADITLVPDDPADPIQVHADATLLGELVDNLLDNASKYSDPGTPITVQVRRDGLNAQVTVEDRGIGIGPSDVSQILTPFYRTRQARDRDGKGLGLGLAVADRIARVFGGSLAIASQPDQGSTFALLLPIMPSDDGVTLPGITRTNDD